MKLLPTAPDGRKPTINTVRNWAIGEGWNERADALDADAAKKMDVEVIRERVKTLKELAKGGESLMQKGIDYLEAHPDMFEGNPSAVVRAIVAGAEMRWKYAGQAALLQASTMSDSALQKEIIRLLGKESDTNNENDDETINVIAEDSEEADDQSENDNA